MLRRIFLIGITSCLTFAARANDPAAKIAGIIDKHLISDWAIQNIQPAPKADDLTFLRRASLDLIGRIPTLEEIQQFKNDTSADKRTKLLDRLLTSSDHAIHFASVTRVDWMPQSLGNFRLQFQGAEFESWLEKQISKNRPFNQIVTEILEADAAVGQRGMVNFSMREGGTKQALAAFYEVADGKPESMAAATSRLFLGVKLECAQCHDHPFAPYTKEQFWEFAAFFGEFTPLSPVAPSFVGPLTPQFESNRIVIPNTVREVTAKYFTGGEPTWQSDRSPRKELAAWLTDSSNRLFARNFANRLWLHLFGIGILDPIDEPGDANPPSHPALLDALTDAAIESKFNIRDMLKGIALSRAYQLSSSLTHPSQSEPKHFARMTTKALTGHQIYDSLNTSANKFEQTKNEGVNTRRFAANEVQGGSRGEFVSRFPQSHRRTESATSILQSLMLMNGNYVSGLTTLDKNPLLGEMSEWTEFTDTYVEKLYLATLCRKPTASELKRHVEYINTGGPSENPTQALADIYWVLINSTEFLMNH